MADFLPLLTRAIAGLENNTSEARRALYDRARSALVAQLRSMTPPPSESEITRERLGLEEAIRKIETEISKGQRFDALARSGPAPAEPKAPPKVATDPSSPGTTRPDPARAEPRRPEPTRAEPVRPKPVAPSAPPPAAPEPARPIAFPSREKIERFAAPDSTRQMFREAVKQAAEARTAAPTGQVVRVSREQVRRQPEPVIEEPEPPSLPPEPEEAPAVPAAPAQAATPEIADEAPPGFDPAAPDPAREPARDAGRDVVRQTRAALRAPPPDPEEDGFDALDDGAPPVRSPIADDRLERARRRVAAKPPVKDKSKDKKRRVAAAVDEDDEPRSSGRLRFWSLVIAGLAVVVVAAALGLLAASGWLGLSGPQVQKPPGPPPAQERPKIADRITTAEPARPNGAARPAQPPAPAQALPTQTQGPAQALVAQRAILYEEDPAAGQQGQILIGTVAWRTETITPAGGLPPDVAVKADVQVPDRRMSMVLTLKRNADQALPASHTIELQFTTPPDFPFGGVSKVPGILTKRAEGQRGAPLAGLAVDVTPGFFIVGLSAIETDVQRNVQLLRERSWIDIPIVYKNGRRAILSVEKGLPGERAINDALAAWGQ